MSIGYTKADLEEIVYKQLENLNAIQDLLGIMKFQNDLIQNINRHFEKKSFNSRSNKLCIQQEEIKKVLTLL